MNSVIEIQHKIISRGKTNKEKFKSIERLEILRMARLKEMRIDVNDKLILPFDYCKSCNEKAKKCLCGKFNPTIRHIPIDINVEKKICQLCLKLYKNGKPNCLCAAPADENKLMSYRNQTWLFGCKFCKVVSRSFGKTASLCTCSNMNKEEIIIPVHIPGKKRWNDRLSLIKTTSKVKEDSVLPHNIVFSIRKGVKGEENWKTNPDKIKIARAAILATQAAEGTAKGFLIRQPDREKMANAAYWLLPIGKGRKRRLPIIESIYDELRVLIDLSNLEAETSVKGEITPLFADVRESLPLLIDHWINPKYGNPNAHVLWSKMLSERGFSQGDLTTPGIAQDIVENEIIPAIKQRLFGHGWWDTPPTYPWLISMINNE